MLLRFTILFLFFIITASVYSQAPEQSSDTDRLLTKSVYFSYFLGNGFIQVISGNYGPTTALVQEIDKAIDDGNPTVSDIFRLLFKASWTYLGFVVLIIFGLVFVLLLPIIGFIVCCCRCCGNCGGYVNPMDEKKDPCRRGVYSFILLILITLKTAAIVVAFINNYLANNAVMNPNAARIPLQQGLDSLNNTLWATVQRTKDPSISGNLEKEKEAFDAVLIQAFNDFKKDFRTKSGASSFIEPIENFIKLSQSYQKGQDKQSQLNEFLDAYATLDRNLQEIREDLRKQLEQSINSNNAGKLKNLEETINKTLVVRMPTDFNDSQIRTLLEQLYQDRDKIDQLNEFSRAWEKMDIKQQIQRDLDDAWDSLSKDQEIRNNLASAFEDGLSYLSPKLASVMQLTLNTVTIAIENNYRYYIGYGVLCVPSLIAVCLYFGVCFGICGRRPRAYVGFCNKNVGANFLLGSVILIFLFAPLLMLVCVQMFSTFGLFESTTCGPLAHPSRGNTATLDIAYQMSIKRNENYQERMWVKDLTPFEAMWLKCKNQSMINSFGGGMIKLPIDNQLVIMLDDLLKKIKVNEIKDEIRAVITSTTDTLQSLESNYQSIQLDQSITALAKPITKVDDWNRFFGDLQSVHPTRFEPSIDRLRRQVVEPLDRTRIQISSSLQELLSLSQLWDRANTNVENFERSLDQTVDSSVNAAVEGLRGKLLQQLRLAVMAMWQPIDCRDIYQAAHQSSDALCQGIIEPINGYWYGLGFCVILYIPILVFSILLISLYRKHEEYYSDAGSETNYMNYQGFYMADVPNASDSKKRSKRKSKNNSPKHGNQEPALVFSSHTGYQPVSVFAYDAYE